ncbi:hypothetical protein CVT26_012780 [Gymnopilus dilepis]|uniref:Uncharacterized protein n=1 Tax=Gymnopilus dilepis TaxID=231916 RepID=A0A409X0F7_9AGAR|nr:hypothetical protein CVT26_012780 [Gymnopilus dilepis]
MTRHRSQKHGKAPAHRSSTSAARSSTSHMSNATEFPGIAIPGLLRSSENAYTLSLPFLESNPRRPRRVVITASQLDAILEYSRALSKISPDELYELYNGIDLPCPAGLYELVEVLANQNHDTRGIAHFQQHPNSAPTVVLPKGKPFTLKDFGFSVADLSITRAPPVKSGQELEVDYLRKNAASTLVHIMRRKEESINERQFKKRIRGTSALFNIEAAISHRKATQHRNRERQRYHNTAAVAGPSSQSNANVVSHPTISSNDFLFGNDDAFPYAPTSPVTSYHDDAMLTDGEGEAEDGEADAEGEADEDTTTNNDTTNAEASTSA